jgi:hypothetical protein
VVRCHSSFLVGAPGGLGRARHLNHPFYPARFAKDRNGSSQELLVASMNCKYAPAGWRRRSPSQALFRPQSFAPRNPKFGDQQIPQTCVLPLAERIVRVVALSYRLLAAGKREPISPVEDSLLAEQRRAWGTLLRRSLCVNRDSEFKFFPAADGVTSAILPCR